MNVRISIVILFIFLSFSSLLGQNQKLEWFISPSWNLYLPVNNSAKGTYPIIGYDKESVPKLLIGGYGLTTSVLRNKERKISWKGQVNLARYVYWDEPSLMTNPFGTPIVSITTGTVDYFMGFSGIINYSLSKKISVGTGLGSQILFVSLSRLPQFENSLRLKDLIAINRYYRTFQPVIPVELSLKLKSFLFSIRYEYALLNRLKGDLANYKSDKYSVLSFEVGFKLN